jgi:cobaltochelatase CobT
MLQERILKENIDGEALLWAQSGLAAETADMKFLIVLSDGAPVDDSTLAIEGGSYLDAHLREVIPEIERSRTNLIAVGIEHDVTRYYGKSGVHSTVANLGIDLIKLLKKVTWKKTSGVVTPVQRRPAGKRKVKSG